MIMNYQLMAAGFLPVSIAKEKSLDYFEALEAYAVDKDLRLFADMIAELEGQRLDEYLVIGCEHRLTDMDEEVEPNLCQWGFESHAKISKKGCIIFRNSFFDGFSKSRINTGFFEGERGSGIFFVWSFQ